MDAQTVVDRFFTAYYTGDAEGARDTITSDFSLYGPFATCRNPEEFFELAKGLMQVVRGHRVLRWVVEGDNVSALYEIMIQGRSGVRPLTTGGWFTVTDTRVSSGTLLYDSEAFHAILSR
jgi:SnoaL-like domain